MALHKTKIFFVTTYALIRLMNPSNSYYVSTLSKTSGTFTNDLGTGVKDFHPSTAYGGYPSVGFSIWGNCWLVLVGGYSAYATHIADPNLEDSMVMHRVTGFSGDAYGYQRDPNGLIWQSGSSASLSSFKISYHQCSPPTTCDTTSLCIPKVSPTGNRVAPQALNPKTLTGMHFNPATNTAFVDSECHVFLHIQLCSDRGIDCTHRHRRGCSFRDVSSYLGWFSGHWYRRQVDEPRHMWTNGRHDPRL